jgi:hypothetical protein
MKKLLMLSVTLLCLMAPTGAYSQISVDQMRDALAKYPRICAFTLAGDVYRNCNAEVQCQKELREQNVVVEQYNKFVRKCHADRGTRPDKARLSVTTTTPAPAPQPASKRDDDAFFACIAFIGSGGPASMVRCTKGPTLHACRARQTAMANAEWDACEARFP